MSNPMWSKDRARQIHRRIVVTGDLMLRSPAHFGNGDSDESVLALQTDSIDPSRPLLPGPSIAGALRAYLRTHEYGYNHSETTGVDQSLFLTAALFGAPLGGLDERYGEQSRLLIDDSIGVVGANIDYRDGVRIDPVSRTALDKGLYTFQTWAAGTTFPIRVELLVTADADELQLRKALATALNGLSNGEITLGARKKRGFGQVEVGTWTVWDYDLHTPAHLLAWLKHETPVDAVFVGNAFQTLGVYDDLGDNRQRFTIKAKFDLDGSILIRATGNAAADMVHLKSGNDSVISGTSLAGAIRSRSSKIIKTLGGDAESIINPLFGRHGDEANDSGEREPSASRVIVRESIIEGGVGNLVQNRVSIDRFTGGALDTALFSEQPHWGGAVELNLELRSPSEAEIGLLLLVLKDLWTGDLPIGGESSVGRGRLMGLSAMLIYHANDDHGTPQTWEWSLTSAETGLSIEGAGSDWLEGCVVALVEKVGVR